MMSPSPNTDQVLLNFGFRDQERIKRYSHGFSMMLVAYVILFFAVIQTSSLFDFVGALLISVACLLPSYLWVRATALGLPIFPVFALAHLPFYVFPLISLHEETHAYNEYQRFVASLVISLFLMLATFIWVQFVNRRPNPPREVMQLRIPLDSRTGLDFFILVALIISVGLQVAIKVGYLNPLYRILPNGSFSAIRALTGATILVTIFLGFLRYGMGGMKRGLNIFLIGTFLFLVLQDATDLILMSAFTFTIPAIFGYSLGRKKVPVLLIIVTIGVFAFLNLGKHQMRMDYWGWAGTNRNALPISQIPSVYSDWGRSSLAVVFETEQERDERLSQQAGASANLLHRASMMHLLLLTINSSPEPVPYMKGQTYKIIPQLLTPRIINPSKPSSHEGQVLINVHYGLQTRENAEKTFLAWGLLPEAHANFGILGVVGFAMLVGAGLGWLTRISMLVPLLSFRAIVASLILFQMADNENVMSLFVTSTFQLLVIITFLSKFVMQRLPNPFWEDHRREATLNEKTPSQETGPLEHQETVVI